MKMKSYQTLFAASVLAITLGACAAAPGYSDSEQEVVNNLTPSNYQPATRNMRESIETQDQFAQAAFWSREYDLNPADLEAAVKLAAAVRKMGNPGRAVEITQTTRALYPTDPYLIAEYAAALIASERGEEALEPLSKALGTTPSYARLWSLKGAALDQLERYDLARQHYGRALQISPNDPNIMANMGLNFALSGDPVKAEHWMRRAATMPGAGENIRRNLDLVMQLQGKSVSQTAASNPQHNMAQSAQRPSSNYQRQLSPHQAQTSRPPMSSNNQAHSNQKISQNPFSYSTQVYTGFQSGPKSASEAAMAAARQSGQMPQQVPSQMRKPDDILGQIARTNQQKQNTAYQAHQQRVQAQARQMQYPQQQQGYPNGYQQPVQLRSYPPSQSTQYAPQQQRRGAARTR